MIVNISVCQGGSPVNAAQFCWFVVHAKCAHILNAYIYICILFFSCVRFIQTHVFLGKRYALHSLDHDLHAKFLLRLTAYRFVQLELSSILLHTKIVCNNNFT